MGFCHRRGKWHLTGLRGQAHSHPRQSKQPRELPPRLGSFRPLKFLLPTVSSKRFKSVLMLTGAVTLLLSCSLSLNVNGPGDTPATPTSIQAGVRLAVVRTLTALARTNQENLGQAQATGDATQVAVNVDTLVAQAVQTLQPTPVPNPPTRVPVRSTKPPLPPTAKLAPPPTETPAPMATAVPTDTPTRTHTPQPTSTPLPTNTPTFTPTNTPTPTKTFTPTAIPTHCPTEYCVIMQRCEPGENTRAIGTIYENDHPKNGVRVRVSYAMGGPPVLPDFISGNDPNNPNRPDPQHPGYYQLGLLEGGALEGNWWVFIVDDKGKVLSEGRYFKTAGQRTATSCQVGIADFYR